MACASASACSPMSQRDEGGRVFKLLIDTCVWLDLAKDHQQQAILGALEELTRQGEVSLILPRTVVDEFARNKTRIIEESSRRRASLPFSRVPHASPAR